MPTRTFAFTVGHANGRGLSPEVSPGDNYSQTLFVKFDQQEPACDVYVEILDYKEQGSQIEAILPQEANLDISAVNFFTPQKIVLHCEKDKYAETKVNISIPENIKSGGYYAVLRFSTVPFSDNVQTGIIKTINLPVKFTVKGNEQLVHTGKINAVKNDNALSGKPIQIITEYSNTGNHHYSVKGTLEIKDLKNKIIDTVFINSSSPIPGSSKNIISTYIPKDDLPTGYYIITETLSLEDGTLLDEAEGQFEVKAPYVPPAAPVNLTLKTSSAATLKTDDGRITIDFPQGSVTGDTLLSLRSFPQEQLPGIPEGYISSSTCFRIDGLTGLLLNPAIIRVKYSSPELEKAGGDPSRLILARWDETGSKWTLLKTSLDSKSQILSTETNQFSLWTIFIGPPSSFKLNWPIIVVAFTLLLIIVLSAIILRPKSKKSKL